ncbi:MAG: phosphoenolpyruvate synthase [Nanoarchaeota archaeon]|nr:phosphoenolpyruvate synthase [Nanoarchaeota archaeon]
MREKEVELIKWFSELSNKDVSIAGGKGASLAEMYNIKMPIPPGFIITAQAYASFIKKTGIENKIQTVLNGINVDNTEALNNASKKIRSLIESTELPEEFKEAIEEAYDILSIDKQKLNNLDSAPDLLKESHEEVFVAVRSSATTEDLAEASFAGQQESFLNVRGIQELLQKVKECIASLFTSRAIYYREKKGFSHAKTYLAVVVQKMINSEKSGVIFSQNPTSSEKTIVIEAVWGLGEGIVSGQIKPDHYVVSQEFDIKEVKVTDKKIAIIKNKKGKTETISLDKEKAKEQVLNNHEIKLLAQYAKQLEEHYKKPQDIEFAIEGDNIFIVQSRPITTFYKESKKSNIKGKVLLSGMGASPGVASGIVKLVYTLADLEKVKKGDVLVTKMTSPDMVVAMQRASGIVTDEGGITSHAAIVSREMGIPAVVGTERATASLQDGDIITVDGNEGKVIEGKGEEHLAEVLPVVPTKTKIKVIVDLPDFAERAAKSGVQGVGLLRLEGIIAEGGKHPTKFVQDNKINDYISLISEGVSKIVEHFNEVWVRSSDIRSDEYRHLEGAPQEVEGNPMLGDHGIRFNVKHLEILKAELIAVKEVADDFPKKKIGFMIPQVISVSEIQKTKELAKEVGLPKNVKIGIMVETPAAVQIIEDICKEGLDFISFGTNDLTQYTLAIDRNNAEVQNLYNEAHPAVINSLIHVIKVCKQYGVETSICGQAGSREDVVTILIKEGIDSISVNADAAQKISQLVARLEGESDSKESDNLSFIQSNNEPIVSKIEMEQVDNEDIEELVLKELEDDNNEYNSSGKGDKKEDIPPLGGVS